MSEDGSDSGPVGRDSTGRGLVDFAREHPGLFATAGYASATGIGMLSSFTLYGSLGINIFHYAQLSDFVLVAVRNPFATLAILLAIPVVWVLMAIDDRLSNRFSWYKYIYGGARLRSLSRTPVALVLYLVAYAYVFALVYSGRAAEQIRMGNLPTVEIQFASGEYLGRDATRPFETGMIGATSTWVFLWDTGDGIATAVPTENVVSIQPR